MPSTDVKKAPQATCPTCGAQLPDRPFSLCPYCAAPLELGGRDAGDGSASPNAARIAKIEVSPRYEGVMAFTPPESLEHHQGSLRSRRGRSLAILGAVLLAIGPLWLAGAIYTQPTTWVGALLMILGIRMMVQGSQLRSKATQWPLLKRAAVIRERRSETNLERIGGNTVYYFEIEFGDGTVVEFAYPGNGSGEDLYTNGLSGVAFTRGQQLLHFQLVRA